MTDTITVVRLEDAPITRVTLRRPAEGNTLDIDTARALEAAVQTAVGDGTRVLLLEAEGKLFCGGGDVRAMATASDPSAYTRDLASSLHRSLLAIAESDLLFVCAVQGAAAGAGFSIVLNADYVVAAERASFVAAYLTLGVTPDGGGSYLLPRVVGKARASELFFAGRKLDAATAHEWGVVNEVVEADALGARAMEIASAMAEAPAGAVGATKGFLNEGWIGGYRDHLEREAASIAALIASEESRARQAAFLGR